MITLISSQLVGKVALISGLIAFSLCEESWSATTRPPFPTNPLTTPAEPDKTATNPADATTNQTAPR